jgi:TatA/E family protein of Tat protein translocase
VFGIGVQEMVIVGLLFLVIFGPSKVPDMARDLGRFVNVARRSVEEFKEDLISEEDEPHKDRGQQASEELEASVRREDDAVVDQSVPATK